MAIRNVHSWDFAAVDVLANDRLAPEAADQNGILREIKGQDGF